MRKISLFIPAASFLWKYSGKKCPGSYKKNRNIKIRLTLRAEWAFDQLLKFSSLLIPCLWQLQRSSFFELMGFFLIYFLFFYFFPQVFHSTWMKNCFSSAEMISGNFHPSPNIKDELIEIISFSGRWEVNWKILVLIFQPSCGLIFN